MRKQQERMSDREFQVRLGAIFADSMGLGSDGYRLLEDGIQAMAASRPLVKDLNFDEQRHDLVVGLWDEMLSLASRIISITDDLLHLAEDLTGKEEPTIAATKFIAN